MRRVERWQELVTFAIGGLVLLALALGVMAWYTVSQPMHGATSQVQGAPARIHGHVEEERPEVAADARARLAAAGVPDPGARVLTTTTVTVDPRTGRQDRGLTLWSDVLVTQQVPDLTDCGALGDRASRILDTLAGLPRLAVTERVRLTFMAGPEERSVVYTSEQAASVLGTGLGGVDVIRAGRPAGVRSEAWDCFR